MRTQNIVHRFTYMYSLIKIKIKFSSYVRKFRWGCMGANSYIRKGFLIYEEIRKHLTIYDEAVSHI
jgi:hypothetical protein